MPLRKLCMPRVLCSNASWLHPNELHLHVKSSVYAEIMGPAVHEPLPTNTKECKNFRPKFCGLKPGVGRIVKSQHCVHGLAHALKVSAIFFSLLADLLHCLSVAAVMNRYAKSPCREPAKGSSSMLPHLISNASAPNYE